MEALEGAVGKVVRFRYLRSGTGTNTFCIDANYNSSSRGSAWLIDINGHEWYEITNDTRIVYDYLFDDYFYVIIIRAGGSVTLLGLWRCDRLPLPRIMTSPMSSLLFELRTL